MHAWTFDAIGTRWQIDTREPLPADAQSAVLERIGRFDQVWSRFRDDSLIADIARGAGEWKLPDEADWLLGFYADLYEMTGGAVTPLIGRTLSDLGYDADYSLAAATQVSGVPNWRSWQWDEPILTTLEPLLIDVGAAGKGLLVDLVAQVVAMYDTQFTVDASGDLFHHGTSPIRVALEHPLDPSKAIGVATVEPQQALCASAINRRAWGDGLHHVLDGRTGRPTRDVIATWAIVDQARVDQSRVDQSCMCADGLATAHFFADPAVLTQKIPHTFVRMFADGQLEWSPDFNGELFL